MLNLYPVTATKLSMIENCVPYFYLTRNVKIANSASKYQKSKAKIQQFVKILKIKCLTKKFELKIGTDKRLNVQCKQLISRKLNENERHGCTKQLWPEINCPWLILKNHHQSQKMIKNKTTTAINCVLYKDSWELSLMRLIHLEKKSDKKSENEVAFFKNQFNYLCHLKHNF